MKTIVFLSLISLFSLPNNRSDIQKYRNKLSHITTISNFMPPPEQEIFRFRSGSKFGFKDRNGKVVIEPKFDFAYGFREGLAAICVNCKVEEKYNRKRKKKYYIAKSSLGSWGFIDKTGKIVIEPKFDRVNFFSEGSAVVKVNCKQSEKYSSRKSGGKYGYIDKKGQYIATPQFDSAKSFNNGVAAVCINPARDEDEHERESSCNKPFIFNKKKTNMLCAAVKSLQNRKTAKWGYIDQAGQYLIKPQFEQVGRFYCGLAPVKRKTEQKWGYIDKKGEYIIKPIFNEAFDFISRKCIAYVRIDSQWQKVDKTGKLFPLDNSVLDKSKTASN